MRFKRRKTQSIKRSTPKKRTMPRFRRARRVARTVYRTARKSYRRSSSRGFGGGGTIMRDVEGALGKSILYQGVAQKFAPQFAPIAGLYGGWKGGGLTGLAVSELFVKPFIGLPSNLGNLTGLLGNLGLGSQTSTQTGMTGAV